jgi:EAL domain-containing protein (putative c-di-GMP-specific phosphodiesterase class I)
MSAHLSRVVPTAAGRDVPSADALENLGTALLRAWQRSEFAVAYQPQFRVADGAVRGVEALLRWFPAGTQGPGPREFVPILETCGLISKVGAWVLDRAARQWCSWKKQAIAPDRITVNVSGRQLVNARLAHALDSLDRQLGVEPSSIELELTETVLLSENRRAVEEVLELHDRGVRFAIDDFGTGFSTLDLLRWLPASTVKIDRRFVAPLPAGKRELAIVSGILSMCRDLGIEVIAEGVETLEQLELLTDLGCDAIQGHVFAWAADAHATARLLVLHAHRTASAESGR